MVDMQYVPAANTSAGSNLPIDRIVVHGTVSRTFVGGALSVARYFADPNAGGSAHVIVDPATAVRSVPDRVVAWHAPPNPRSLGLEFCDLVLWNQDKGRTAAYYDPRLATPQLFAARWQRPEWQSMLRLGAQVVRDWADTYKVPLTRIQAPLTGNRGVCGHIDVSLTWRQTNHSDPGPDFPWGQFMQLLQSPDVPAPAPAPPVEEPMAPYLLRAKTGVVLFVADDGVRLVKSTSDLASLQQMGVKYGWTGGTADFANMDEGPFAMLVDLLGGVKPSPSDPPVTGVTALRAFFASPDVAHAAPAGAGIDPPRHDAGQDMSGGVK